MTLDEMKENIANDERTCNGYGMVIVNHGKWSSTSRCKGCSKCANRSTNLVSGTVHGTYDPYNGDDVYDNWM